MQTIQNGTQYDNNYARAAAYFLGTCASAPAGGERLAAYRIITGIYGVIADDPASVGWKALPDVSFAPWEQQKGREKDIKAIRGAINKIETLIAELFAITEAAELLPDGALLPAGIAPGRTLGKALAKVGVTIAPEGERVRLFAPLGGLDGLKSLAAVSRAHVIHVTDAPHVDLPYLHFSRCVFEPDENWLAAAFDRLLNADGRLIRLCDELEQRGYRRVDCFDGWHITLDYVKQYGRKNEPLKWSWAEKTHAGIAVTYEDLRLAPCFFWIRLPMFRTILEHADALPAPVSDFLERCTKTCDGCRYCVQTDKTHTRPLACVKVHGKNKCPHFPGFTMNWRSLPSELAEHTLALLDAVEALPELQEKR